MGKVIATAERAARRVAAERHAELEKARHRKPSKPAAPKQPNHPAVKPSHVGTLVSANCYANHNAASQPAPDVLGVGEGSANKRVFTTPFRHRIVANNKGFAYWAAEATGWIPDPFSEFSKPGTAYIGGPNGGVMNRGPMVHFTSDGTWAGLAPSSNRQPPVSGTILKNASNVNLAPAGIGYWELPTNFITGQEQIDASAIEGDENRPTYTLSHLSATIEPDGYQTGSANAVNVVSGDILGMSYTAGDNRDYNPFSLSAISSTNDPSTWINTLPAGTVQFQEASITDWKKGDGMTLFAVPNTSTAMGAWPATILDDDSGFTSTVTFAIDSPQIAYFVTGAQPNQRFVVHGKISVTSYGIETYDSSAPDHAQLGPVDSTQLSDTLLRTLPKHAKPLMQPIDRGHPAGVMAFAQHVKDTGEVPPSQIGGFIKTAANVAEKAGASSGIGEVLSEVAEVGLGILGALF